MALLADIYLADEPPEIANNPSDEVFASGDLEGKSAIHLYRRRAKTNTARQFADQSPLRPTETLKPESNDHIVVQTTKRTGRKDVRDAINQPADTTLKMRSQRAHSWDSSQGSEYEYSDEEATNGPTDPDVEMEPVRHDTESEDHDPTDEDSSTDDALEDVLQDEDSQDKVRQRSESYDHDRDHRVIDLENFEDADRTNDQIAQRCVARDHDRSDSRESDYDDTESNGGAYTHPEPRKTSSCQKHKQFGMFAASPAADTEPVAERYMEPPQRLRDLVERRRMERKQQEPLAKKGRYNLRPRRQSEHDDKDLLGAKYSEANELDADIESEGEEPRRSHRITRSMMKNKHSRRVVPRSRAARKTAWVAMGIVPTDEPHGREPNRQVVQVVIPATDEFDKESSRRVVAEAHNRGKQVLDMILID
jgi:hypothetical protein